MVCRLRLLAQILLGIKFKMKYLRKKFQLKALGFKQRNALADQSGDPSWFVIEIVELGVPCQGREHIAGDQHQRRG